MKQIITLIAMAIFISLPGLAQAQWSVGPYLIISVPNSDFANVSGVGGGFGVKGIREIVGPFSLRGDFAFLSHGREFTTVRDRNGTPFIGEVRNESYRITLGPALSTGGRHMRAHVEALAGLYMFRTNTNINTGFAFFQDSKFDAAWGWSAGGGIQYDIGLGPWLDLAFEYQNILNVTTEFVIDENTGETANQDITANELTIKVGVIFFLN